MKKPVVTLSKPRKKSINRNSPVQIFIGTTTRNPTTMGMTGAALSGSFVKAFRDSTRQKLFGAMDALKLLNEVRKIKKGRKTVQHSGRHKAIQLTLVNSNK